MALFQTHYCSFEKKNEFVIVADRLINGTQGVVNQNTSHKNDVPLPRYLAVVN